MTILAATPMQFAKPLVSFSLAVKNRFIHFFFNKVHLKCNSTFKIKKDML